jgi:quinoprotein relay system zinc metallohydrolase 2
VFGNAAFLDTGAEFVGHARLPDALAQRGAFYAGTMRLLLGEAFAGSIVVPPSLLVTGDRELDLGDRKLRLTAWPTAHTDHDLSVLDEASGTLFAGDLVFLERLPVVDGSLNGWLAVLDRLAGVEAVRVVPGHGPASAPWPDAVGPQRAYLETLRRDVRAALAAGVGLRDAVERLPAPPGSNWRLAAETHSRNVTAAYTELEWE